MKKIRDILFRGKRNLKYGTGWCYGVPYIDCDGDCIMATHNSREVVIEDTVGQFTGLYDSTKWESLSKSEQEEWLKNHTSDEWRGRKIFEGDIVKAYLPNKYEFVKNKFIEKIEFRNGCFWFDNWNFIEFLDKFTNYKVIGNIHDNPQMLQE